MSLLSSIILPKLEKELISLEPEIANFIISQIETVGKEILDWVNSKGKEAASFSSKADVPQ